MAVKSLNIQHNKNQGYQKPLGRHPPLTHLRWGRHVTVPPHVTQLKNKSNLVCVIQCNKNAKFWGQVIWSNVKKNSKLPASVDRETLKVKSKQIIKQGIIYFYTYEMISLYILLFFFFSKLSIRKNTIFCFDGGKSSYKFYFRSFGRHKGLFTSYRPQNRNLFRFDLICVIPTVP